MLVATDKQKESYGALATFAWIGSGIYLFSTSQSASFVSWQAAVFFVVGIFFSAIVFGILAHFVQQLVTKFLASLMARHASGPTPGLALFVTAVGVFFMIAQIVLVYLAAKWVFQLLV